MQGMKKIRVMLFSLVATLLLLIAPPVFAQKTGASRFMQPGIDVQHYRFALTLTDESNRIVGETTIRFTQPGGPVSSVWFDLIQPKSDTARRGMRVLSVQSIVGQAVPFSQRADRVYLTLPTDGDGRPDQAREVTIRYEGVPAGGLIISRNKFGERTFFGDNWPNNARNWLPVVDHPSDKATCEFVVTAPAHYRVIANGQLIEESDLPTGTDTKPRKLTHWLENTPIPTKVMVIGAARFAVEHVGTVNCVPVESWVYPADRDKGFFDYRPAMEVLRFFNDSIGPYSYEKLANVESTTMFGGMENASCIFYTERAITGRKSEQIESLVAHEIAHQWFGNSASEKDWAHVWLSEGFATYFAGLYLEHAYGQDTLTRYLADNKAKLFRYLEKKPASVIIDTTTTNLLGLLTPNAYEKGGWVLHMLRHDLGDALFWKGIRAYYARFRNGNAETDDFRAVMEQVSGRDLGPFFRQWLQQLGYPNLVWNWQYDAKKRALLVLVKQVQTNGSHYVLPLTFRVADAAGHELTHTGPLVMDGLTAQFSIPMPQIPATVQLDPDNVLLVRATQTGH